MSKTTAEYLDKQIRRAELSLRRAMRKPNTPPEELGGLNDKLLCLHEAKIAVILRDKESPGRCAGCDSWYKGHCTHGPCAAEPIAPTFFCGCFTPREEAPTL